MSKKSKGKKNKEEFFDSDQEEEHAIEVKPEVKAGKSKGNRGEPDWLIQKKKKGKKGGR